MPSTFDPLPFPHHQLLPQAISSMSKGDVAIVFTPDDTHFTIVSACIQAGLHVLVAKPVVKTLGEHLKLLTAAEQAGVLVGGLWWVGGWAGERTGPGPQAGRRYVSNPKGERAASGRGLWVACKSGRCTALQVAAQHSRWWYALPRMPCSMVIIINLYTHMCSYM